MKIKGKIVNNMCKNKDCKHAWKLTAYSSAEGYSAVCMKCGAEFIIGYKVAKINTTDKKIKVSV